MSAEARVPPHDYEAERTVLGAALIDSQAAASLAAALQPGHFWSAQHQRIASAVVSLVAGGEHVDLLTVKAALEAACSLEAAGGVAYLASLCDGLPRVSNVDAWARLIVEKARRRKIEAQLSRLHRELVRTGIDCAPVNSTVIPLSNMKYKILKSIAHNFSHSFVSSMNYFDDGHVVDDLLQLARKANGERVSIHWIPDSPSQRAFPPRVMKSIAHYKEWLPTQIQNSGASVEAIREFRTDIFLKPNKQVAVEAYLVDDRGKKHICNVLF